MNQTKQIERDEVDMQISLRHDKKWDHKKLLFY